MIFLLERSVNSYLQTDGNASKRTRTSRVRTEAPGHAGFSHPAVHWPRPAAPPPLFYLRLLPDAAECRLGPTPTHCEGRLEGSEEPFFLRNFIKAHFNLRNPCESNLAVFLWCIWYIELVQNQSRLKELAFLQVSPISADPCHQQGGARPRKSGVKPYAIERYAVPYSTLSPLSGAFQPTPAISKGERAREKVALSPMQLNVTPSPVQR